jgi:hypothetical protein
LDGFKKATIIDNSKKGKLALMVFKAILLKNGIPDNSEMKTFIDFYNSK